MTSLPGTYREIDSSPVEMDHAKQEWALAVRPELERVAHSYGDVVKYGELAEAVQASSGIRTRTLMHYWIGDVLGRVTAECHRRERAAALSPVRAPGRHDRRELWIALVETYGGDAPDDLDQHSAEERLRCYHHSPCHAGLRRPRHPHSRSDGAAPQESGEAGPGRCTEGDVPEVQHPAPRDWPLLLLRRLSDASG